MSKLHLNTFGWLHPIERNGHSIGQPLSNHIHNSQLLEVIKRRRARTHTPIYTLTPQSRQIKAQRRKLQTKTFSHNKNIFMNEI